MMSRLLGDANDIDPDLELRGGCFKVRFSEKFLKCPFCPDSKDCGYNDLLRHANQILRESKSASFKDKATHMGLAEYLEKEFQAKIKGFCSASVNPNANEELYVWPWMRVVANNDYNRVEVHLLMKLQGHSGLAVVEFGKFMKALEVTKHGGKDWFDREKCKDDNSCGVVGDYLRKNGDLKTVADVQKEDESVILGLKTMIDETNKRCEEMNVKISQTDVEWEIVMKEKEVMTDNFNRDMEIMQKVAQEQLNRITTEHERTVRMLEECEKGLKAREAINETEKRKLDDEREMTALAILEQNMANEGVLKLAEYHKREKEYLQKIIDLEKKLLEKKLDEKQRLELEILHEVMKHMTEEDNEAKNKIELIKNDLKEKEEELEDLEQLNQTLIVLERKSYDELVDAHKELINVLSKNTAHARIIVKIMGDLDEKPFVAAAKRRCSNKREASKNAINLANLWKNHLSDYDWHPFKIITIEGKIEKILDEEDEKIRILKDEYEQDEYDAVVTALKELNKYNPSGRLPVQVLWNKMEGRQATLKEGVEVVLNQWKIYKQRKRG